MSILTYGCLDAALLYAKNGYPVFPVKPDKEPLTQRGFKDATSDSDQIREWYERFSDAGVAIPTGAVTGVVVLDADTEEAEAELHRRGIDPKTPRVKTRRGRHYYFRHPGHRVPCSAGKLFSGLDVRGDGGYVVVPPTPGYSWEVPLV